MDDPINNIKPGEKIEGADKDALAEANLSETNQAHKLAADHRARDAQNQPPLINSLADSIKDKLGNLPPEEGGDILPE